MSRVFVFAISIIVTVFVFSGNTFAHPAWGIAVDRQGQVYFSDLVTVWKVDTQSKLSVFRAGADDRHVHDLNVDEAGNLYGVDNSYEPRSQRFFSAVWKMTPTKDFSYLLAPTDDPPEGTSVWRDRSGNSYHVTHFPERELLVLRRTPSGNVTALVGSSNAARTYRQGAPYSLGGLAFGTDGALYFVHGANISKVTTDGALTSLARNLALENASGNSASGTQLFGIAVDAQGNALVADYGNRRVLKITPDKQITTLVRAEESWFPTGVAVRGGDLYILEYGHTPTHTPIGTRVRKLTSDGKVSVLATVGENTNPPVRETPTSPNTKSAVAVRNSPPYFLFGLCASVSVVGFILWRIRKKRVAGLPERRM